MPIIYSDNTQKKFICVQSGYEPDDRKSINKFFKKLQPWGNDITN